MLSVSAVSAQDESVANLFKVNYETPLTIELKKQSGEPDLSDAPVAAKKKRVNPKIFWGTKTKKGFTKKGFGKKTVTELFFYLKKKDFEGPDEYIQDFYYFDFKKKKIVKSKKIKDPSKVGVLHGRYIKKVGEQILEEGYFYKGKKHGRWMRYNTNDILQDKTTFWKGWPQESQLAFYDYQREKLREVIPIIYGERQGTYYAFHNNGILAATGSFKFDRRVGVWREYYDNRRIKREIVYPENPFVADQQGYITREYSREGKLIYDRNKFFNAGD
ncbi:MAG: antitoxin component YwqK of YwqJK toxin-antitoxin module [Cyclobacteriaceae bacterium]|jgi:antitoxin component YwqK of YwqJK toxin-antitoxin module